MKNDQSLTCMNCKKKRLSLLEGLSFEELEVLDSKRVTASYEKGEIIYKQNTVPTHLLCLSAGKAIISKKDNEGRQQVTRLKKPVDFLGFNEMVSDTTYKTSGVAIERSNVCHISKEDFMDVVRNNNQLSMNIISSVAGELISNEERSFTLNNKKLNGRIADTLLLLKSIFGCDENTGELLATLPRKEMAELSNMNTGNAIRTLSNLAKENIIRLENKKIFILDTEALEKME